jgi:tetratricopeptide (TPR) repeat protein
MAGVDPPLQQATDAQRDAYTAGRDLIINQHAPPAPSEQPRRRMWGNVPARNPAFTGREAMLTAIREALVSGDRAVVQALRGMGGVGKTQVAVEYAHRYAREYDLVWWVNAETVSLIGEHFATLGADLGCVVSGMPVAVVRRAVLEALRDREDWLLVFDNAESPEDIAAWLPGGNGHVLITSRVHGWDELAVPVEVDVMDRAESMEFLRNRVHSMPSENGNRIAEALGDLPLALAQAAGYIIDTGVSSEEYVELLKERAAEILSEGRPASYPRSLAAVTQLTFGRLWDLDRAAGVTASICAFLAPDPVPAAWFAKAAPELPPPLAECAADAVAWQRVIAVLGRSALVRVDQRGMVMHRLTQAIIRSSLPGDQVVITQDLASTILAANHPGDTDHPGNWGGWASILSHLLAVDLGAASSPSLRELAGRAATYMHRRGDVRGSYALAGYLYAQWRDRLGPDEHQTITAAHALADALRGMGRYKEAKELDTDILARWRRALGDDHLDTLRCASNLGADLRGLGDFEAARALHEDTLQRRRRVLGDDHPETLRSASNLAADLRRLGDFEAARALHEDTLQRRRRVLGDDHPETLRSASNLAADLRRLGDFEAARALHEDTLQRRRQVLGDDHPETLNASSNLAADLSSLGDFEAARALYEDTLQRRRRVLGEDHPATLRSARKLAESQRLPGEI